MIIDDIGSVVQAIRNGGFSFDDNGNQNFYDESVIKNGPYFDAGHRQQIVNNVTQKEMDKVKKKMKFPLIALKTDIVESVRGAVTDYTLNIVIATSTNLNWSEFDRIEKNYKPILYPLLDAFKEMFSDSGLGFFWPGDRNFPPCSKIDRAFYGTQDGDGNSRKNIFNEPVDAIEIVNMKFSQMTEGYGLRKHSYQYAKNYD